MSVAEILDQKGRRLIVAKPESSIAEIAELLRKEGIGAVLALEADGKIAGIISERDVVRGLAEHGAGLLEMTAADLMTTTVITCTPESVTEELMDQMLSGHIRHLPVLAGNDVVGIVSIGDVVKSVYLELKWIRGALEQQVAKSTAWATDED